MISGIIRILHLEQPALGLDIGGITWKSTIRPHSYLSVNTSHKLKKRGGNNFARIHSVMAEKQCFPQYK